MSTTTRRPERPGAASWVPSGADLDELRAAAQTCRGCELWEPATQAVMGAGPTDARLMVIGEQPGDKEDLAGEPFVGPAGRLLVQALEAANLAPADVFRTNAVKHFRFSGTRGKQRIHQGPSRVHVTACGPWLMAELGLVRPDVVVALGSTAGQALYGASFRVGATRGQRLEWPSGLALEQPPRCVVPTTHPSAILRSRERERDMAALVVDLKVAATALADA